MTSLTKIYKSVTDAGNIAEAQDSNLVRCYTVSTVSSFGCQSAWDLWWTMQHWADLCAFI